MRQFSANAGAASIAAVPPRAARRVNRLRSAAILMVMLSHSRNLDSNSVEHFPYTARRRWHIDVAQSNTAVKGVDDSVDDRWRRADSAGLTRTLDAQWVGCRGHVMG